MDPTRLELDSLWTAVAEERAERERLEEQLQGLLRGLSGGGMPSADAGLPLIVQQDAELTEVVTEMPSSALWSSPAPSDSDLVEVVVEVPPADGGAAGEAMWGTQPDGESFPSPDRRRPGDGEEGGGRPPVSPTAAILAEVSVAVDGADILGEILGEPVSPAAAILAGASVGVDGADILGEILGDPIDTDFGLGDIAEGSGGSPEAGPPGSAVLLIGDSMLSRADFRCDPPRRLSVCAVPGLTLSRWLRSSATEVRAWVCGKGELTDLQVILWLGGNDVYPRGAAFDPVTVVATLGRLKETIIDTRSLGCAVTILGVTPRPARDGGRVWESTPAFWLERALCELCRETDSTFVALGRRLCRREGRKRRFKMDGRFFSADGIHLSAAGYRRLMDYLPGWLRRGRR
ncbi:hypothetical protein FJT64_015254 [Amphibalanus amphitrite]|uniref:SGNH hydrolase-type esterase domain-containing protein n=1 Tax=Amphibalanus amphitrite TaxID=1232801 RepID=A0A6A4X3J2_AMPAM|nr:hypothetical protein FJT64_015254 [Amphibalanus amphitrite]